MATFTIATLIIVIILVAAQAALLRKERDEARDEAIALRRETKFYIDHIYRMKDNAYWADIYTNDQRRKVAGYVSTVADLKRDLTKADNTITELVLKNARLEQEIRSMVDELTRYES